MNMHNHVSPSQQGDISTTRCPSNVKLDKLELLLGSLLLLRVFGNLLEDCNEEASSV